MCLSLTYVVVKKYYYLLCMVLFGYSVTCKIDSKCLSFCTVTNKHSSILTQNSLLRNYDLVQDWLKMLPNGFVCWKRAMKVKAPPTEFEHSISSGCLFENDDVTERKLVKRSNKLHWVKTFKKEIQNTQWRLLI